MEFPVINRHGTFTHIVSGSRYEFVLSAAPAGGSVLMADIPDRPSYWDAGQWHDIPPQTDPYTTWDESARQWVDRRSVAEAIADRWSVVRDARNRLDRSPITVDGRTFDATSQSQIEIRLRALEASAALAAGDASWSVTWTLADNTDSVLTAQQMIAVADALQDRRNSIRTSASAFRAAIQQATTLQAVLSVPDPL